MEELNLRGEQTYSGSWFGSTIFVYEAKEENELDRIINDDSDWSNVNGCIRISDGSTMGEPDTLITVNDVEMWSWTTPHDSYKTLNEYFDSILVTSPRNVAALMVDLAKANFCSLSKLLKTYQG